MGDVFECDGAEPPPALEPRKAIEPPPPGADARRADGWPVFTDLLASVRDGLREVGSQMAVANSARELTLSLERLHDPYIEPGALKLATDLGRALVTGDVKTVQSLLNQHKGTEVWDSAVSELADHMQDVGLYVLYDDSKHMLRIVRPPSGWVKGPEALALEFKAGAEAPKIFEVSHKAKRALGGDDDPWDYKQVERNTADVGQDIAKTTRAKLDARKAGIDSAKQSVAVAGALLLLKEKDPPPEDPVVTKAKEITQQLLDKNIAPLVRLVKTSKDKETLEKFTVALNEQLRSIGLYAEAKDGMMDFGCLVNGTADGWAIVIPRSADVPPKGATGNTKEFREDTVKPQPAVLVPVREPREVSPQKALREMLERVAYETNLRRR